VRRVTAAGGSSLFLAVAPGVVAGLVPWWLTGWDCDYASRWWVPTAQVAGWALVLGGSGVLVHAFVRFVVEGAGTPAPVAPTDRLVVGGLYRHVRNPMYVAVVAVILGQALVLGQLVLVLYAVAGGAVMAGFVRWYEEPVLARRFGRDYEAYRQAVPAWRPRLRPWRADATTQP
jgi:protein-S-isoprenylcysteine O-methyltransferase Ste14